jgi:hypothetical protein
MPTLCSGLEKSLSGKAVSAIVQWRLLVEEAALGLAFKAWSTLLVTLATLCFGCCFGRRNSLNNNNNNKEA